MQSQSNSDGGFGVDSGLATAYQTTAEAVRALRALGHGADVAAADGFLRAETYAGTEYLARRIIANAEAGTPEQASIAELLSHQNPDGGFGELAGFDSNSLDTSFALEALTEAGQSSSPAAGLAVEFLLRQQRADGGWGSATGDSSVYLTAQVARVLGAYSGRFAGVSQALADASNFLLSERGADAGWAEDFLSAQTLLTLVSTVTDLSTIGQSAEALRARQLANASWANDVYTTALALRALRVFDARNVGTSTGSVSGYVLKAGTGEPIAEAVVASTSQSGVAAHTNGDGHFVLSGVPAGAHTLVAQKAGYAPVTKVAGVQSGRLSEAGAFHLSQDSRSGLFLGEVFDSVTRLPLAGVEIVLSGSVSLAVVSSSDGTFDFGALLPGGYTVTLTKDGYNGAVRPITISAGTTTSLRQELVALGVYLDDKPAALRGRIVDGVNGLPLASASVSLSDGRAVEADAQGGFIFDAVARGDYDLSASASGFVAKTFSFMFAPGATGNLGDLVIFPAAAVAAPDTLNLMGTLIDGVANSPVGGASVTLVQTGQSLTSDADGRFTFSGIRELSFDLAIAASGFDSTTFHVDASGFGEVAATFPLPPAGGDDTATSTTLHGTVRDAATGGAIARASVSISGSSLATRADDSGVFELSGIDRLDFSLVAAAPGYLERDLPINIARHGTYQTDIALEADPSTSSGGAFQVVSLLPLQTESGANTVQRFAATVVNLASEDRTAVIVSDVFDGAGLPVATIEPYAPGTETPASQFSFAPAQALDLVVPWNTAQLPPGTYRVQLRIVEPGTISQALPMGTVLAQGETFTSVAATQAINGQLAFEPPLLQSGANQPTALSSLVVNAGNVPLIETGFTLTVSDPSNGQVLHSARASAEFIDIGNNSVVDFGAWIPPKAGDLPVTVRADDASVAGGVEGTLFVGDKATGVFTIDRQVVPLGTQPVRGAIAMQGVDVRTAASTDPLFFAVQEALRKGGEFVAPTAAQWKRANRCLGCHIQTQSLVGLQGASDKAPINPAIIQFLYNDIVGSQQNDGGLRDNNFGFSRTQTALGSWALADWPDIRQVFRTQYRAAVNLLTSMRSSGDQSWWDVNHCSGWWCTREAMNMMATRGLASVLSSSQALGTDPVDDYVLEDAQAIDTSGLMDFEEGHDGRMYFVDLGGTLSARDLDAQSTTSIATGLPAPSYGIALKEDGTAFVSSQSMLTQVDADGTKSTLLSGSGFGLLTDVVMGDDGMLYVADNSKHTIWRVSESGQFTVFAQGGLLNRPFGLAFDDHGDLLVSNFSGFNVLRIKPDGTVSIFADGLPYAPYWIKRGPDGEFYVLSARKMDSGQNTPVGLYRIKATGFVERLLTFDAPNGLGLNALGVVGETIYVDHASSKRMLRLTIRPLDTGNLEQMRQALAGVARFTLAGHRDNTTDNIVQATRLIALGETRDHIEDPGLLAQIDGAVGHIADLLRQRQRVDGGWGRTTGSGSDSLMTAMVGMALDYTNPSVNDPAVRGAISFLLSRQEAAKSWPNENGIFSTRLASSSFVMAYLPLALERLGGIDIDLNLVMPPSVQLSNPTMEPTAQQANPDGSSAFTWHLQGVTSRTRSVEFNLTLHDLVHREERPVAAEAFLEFASSFNDTTLRADLAIPRVKAVSDLTLQLSTDQASYPADGTVAITSLVANVGPPQQSGQVHLYIRAPGEASPLVDLGVTSFGAIETQASLALPSTWNTGRRLVGGYEVHGQLFDQSGRLVDEAAAPFAIVHEGQLVGAQVTTDRLVYQAWDTVALTSRIRNSSFNALQPAGVAELTVRGPDGEAVHFATYSVDQLPPGGLRDFPDDLRLVDAVGGEYSAELVVKEGSTRSVVATATTSFRVERDALQGLAGKVEVQSTRILQGDLEVCIDTVNNLSSAGLAGVRLTGTLVSLDQEAVLSTDEESKDFAGREQYTTTRNVETSALPVGGYACVLSATFEGRTQPLGSAGFQVLAPPIRIDAALEIGDRGRLLVLLDDPESGSPGAPDPHGPVGAPDLPAQRAFLEALLTAAGWSYTIVTDPDAFARELRSGGYRVYALFAEQAKLDEQVQKELREAVYRGEGLLDAGEHDQRHHAFDDALGIVWRGKHSGADGLELLGSELHDGGFAELSVEDKHLKANVAGAGVVGRFTNAGTADAAVTVHDFGRGKSAYGGFDLLAEAARADAANPGEASLFAELLFQSLDYVHSSLDLLATGQVVPIRLTLNNRGIATSGRVLLPLPATVQLVDPGVAEVSQEVLIWPFELDENQELAFQAWVRLRPDADEIALDALVQTGIEGDYRDHSTAALVLRPEIRPDLEQARLLAASDRAFKPVVQWLDQAAEAVRRGDYARALFTLVQASDEVAKVEHPGAAALRLAIAQTLWETGRRL